MAEGKAFEVGVGGLPRMRRRIRVQVGEMRLLKTRGRMRRPISTRHYLKLHPPPNIHFYNGITAECRMAEGKISSFSSD
jgi:hypothetical protein